jgi:hypothetical protein
MTTVEHVNEFIKEVILPDQVGKISDGYHTFDELYDHRIAIYISLCKALSFHFGDYDIWRTKVHSDASVMEGWFLLGIFKESGKQITYHLPLEKWRDTEFAETLMIAPMWDGHTPEDVLERIGKL